MDTDLLPSKPQWGERLLSGLLMAVIVLTIGSIIYLSNLPNTGEALTEFYILGMDGKAAQYPVNVLVGNPVQLTLGIINHERQKTDYRVVISISGTENQTINGISLDKEEKWEGPVSFTPNITEERQKVTLFLYKLPQDSQPQELYIWVSIKSQLNEH